MIKQYLKSKIDKKGIAVYRLHRISGVSTTAINQILSGKTEKPDPKTLKRLALAFNEPYEEWLAIAGHIDGSQTIKDLIEKNYTEFEKDFLEIYEELVKLPQEKQVILINAIKSIIQGMK